jgi:hypothetical protein
VVGYHIGEHQEFRFQPSTELPSADELAALVARTSRLDLLESVGPLRMSSTLTIQALGLTGEVTTLFAWPDRFRQDSTIGEESERLAFDGEVVRYVSSTSPLGPLEGARAEMARLDNLLAIHGDWHHWVPHFEVIQRLEEGGEEIFLVRMGDTSGPASTLFVHLESGRVVHEDGMTFAPGVGRIGFRANFGDFRDVSGLSLPHRTDATLANPLIGKLGSPVAQVDVGVELPEGTFELEE